METLDSGHNVGSGCCDTTSEQKQSNGGGVRGEIDTSAPFESVKEAVTRFGGLGFWKPHSKHLLQSDNEEEFDAAKAEMQAAQLATDLMVKERETLEVLKELESTKTLVEELKVKLQRESAAVNNQLKEVNEPREENDENAPESQSTPGSILMELKQAKLNLTRTTSDLADIRATVETYSKMIEKERFELEKTRQRLSSNVSSFDEKIDTFPRELHRLTSETERFKKVGETAKSEVLRSMNQIKQTKKRIKTAEIRLIAARKLKEAARASEALARFEIKSISESQSLLEGEGVTLSFEEYNCLKSKAQEADESLVRKVNKPEMKSISESQTLSEGGDVTLSFNNYNCLKSKAQDADESLVKKVNELVKVNEPELYKAEILNKVEEATEEVKHSKRVLEEALSKAKAANTEKIKAQEAFSKWRSDHGRRRKSMVHNLAKFKNSSSRSNTGVLDVNRVHLGSNVSGPILAGPILAPTMSIGQILNRKLLLTEEYYEKSDMKRKVSLAQMLSKPTSGSGSVGGGDGIGGKGKRKKFGFGRIQFLVTKPSKKKKHIVSPRLSSTIG